MPKYTKSQINTIGRKLLKNTAAKTDIAILDDWRGQHLNSLDYYHQIFTAKTQGYDVIIARRLKRLKTIVDKTQRFPDMRLAEMQDIGGMRLIFNTVSDLENFYKQHIKNELKPDREKNYIKTPQPDGYRGIHLIYNHEGYNIEVQLRSRVEHAWSTAVETIGVFLDYSFKTGFGDKKWREFFALTSDIFAIYEGKNVLAKYAKLSLNDIFAKLTKLDTNIDALKHIVEFTQLGNIAAQVVEKTSYHYAIISLDVKSRTAYISNYSEKDKEKALAEYARLESRGNKYDQVLVAVNKIKELREAYPNYFLDISWFMTIYQKMFEIYRESVVK
jgi:hypothetical protein